MAVLKTDALERALLRKALNVQGVKDGKGDGTILLNLIERRSLEGTDEQLQVMQKGLVKFGHMARSFRNHNDARLAASLAERIELYKQERRKEIPSYIAQPKKGGFLK